EDIILGVVGGRHPGFEFGCRQLAMRDNKLHFWNMLTQEGTCLLDIIDARAHIETLAATISLAQQRFSHEHIVERRNKGPYGEPVDRWRRDDRKFAHAGQGKLERARDWRRRQRQDMDLGAQLLEPLLMLDAEMLLLVDNDESQILEAHPFAEHCMGADNNIDLAGGGAELGGFEISGADHPRHLRDLDRQMREAR